MFKNETSFSALPRAAKRAYSHAKQRATKVSLPILSRDEFVALWNRAAGRCELSGLEFSDTQETGEVARCYTRKGSFPWQPSIDQIRPGFGYHAANCQLVCKAVNIGKNSYQPETFETWVRAVAKRLVDY